MSFDLYLEDVKVAECIDGIFHILKPSVWLSIILARTPEEFLLLRVMPQMRWNDNAREFYGLRNWDPWEICRLTHGMTMGDDLWMRFQDDPPDICWDKVKLQQF